MRRALAAAAAAVTVTTGGIVASTASADTLDGVTVTGRNQYLKPGCVALPTIGYTVPATAGSWTLTATVSGPGSPAGAERSAPDPTTGTMSIEHCGHDGSGTFRVKAGYDSGAGQTTTVATSYKVLPAPARVTLKPSRTSVHTGQNITVTGAASYLDGAGYRALHGWVTLQWRRARTTTWSDWKSFYADDAGSYSKTYAYPFGVGVVVRARVQRYWTATAYSAPSWVARTADSRQYANCTALRAVYAHGVGRRGAVDRTSGTPVTTFYRNTTLYSRNTRLDRDKDGIACEKR